MAETKLDGNQLELSASLNFNGSASVDFRGTNTFAQVNNYRTSDIELVNRAGGGISFYVGNGSSAAKLDTSGNLLVGVPSGSRHTIVRGVSQGAAVLDINNTIGGFGFYGINGGGNNAAATGLALGKNDANGRSINAGGTINASGADYAEYMTKAADCGAIAKGQVVGVDVDGRLTDKWAAAVSFLIKSTDPSYVGGDVWGTEAALGMARPVEPVLELPTYAGAPHPGERPDIPDPADLVDVADKALEQVDPATVDARLLAYDQALAAYQVDQLAHAQAIASARECFDTVTMPAYQVELAKFEALLEQARQRVDRMAYCGQVPVNVTGAVPGQYVVPIQDGEGIGAKLVNKSAMTLAQYLAAVGIVQNILPDGRANVRVKPV